MPVILLKRSWHVCRAGLFGLAMIASASAAAAVSISGIMIYSTDDFGNPNGYETFNGTFQAQMWRTLSRPDMVWYGLGLSSGLPPESIDDAFLNFPDFSIDLPLDEGENYFTLFAEPGPLTATDEYQRFLINVYFDGNLEEPGISVLFPRYAEPDGSPVAEARPNDDQHYGFMLQQISIEPRSYYDDGLHRVSVLRASLLPPERASMSVDRLSAHTLSPGGVDGDWIGALVVSVEPSESFGAGGGVPAPAGGGGSGGGPGAGGAGTGGPLGGGGAYVPPVGFGQPSVAGSDPEVYEGGTGGGKNDDEFWHAGDPVNRTPGEENDSDIDGTPTPADIVGALEQWLQNTEGTTPTPDADAGGAAADGTPSPGTPGSTATPGTKTPELVASTPTPAAAATSPTPVGTPSRTLAAEPAGG